MMSSVEVCPHQRNISSCSLYACVCPDNRGLCNGSIPPCITICQKCGLMTGQIGDSEPEKVHVHGMISFTPLSIMVPV
jgi:hypothetical protein